MNKQTIEIGTKDKLLMLIIGAVFALIILWT